MMLCEPFSQCYLLPLHVFYCVLDPYEGLFVDQLSIVCSFLCLSFSNHPKNTSKEPNWLKKKKKSIGRSMDRRVMRFLLMQTNLQQVM